MSLIQPNFGCSFLVHALAAHPKLVAVSGLALALTMVTTPGPPVKAGVASVLVATESRQMQGLTSEETQALDQALAERPAVTLSREKIQYVLDSFGCKDCSAEDVVNDRKLMRSVTVLYWADVLNRNGGNIDAAKAVLVSPTTR
jgi:hypothetical protein